MGKLYVGNLPWSATEDELQKLFEAHGEVKNVKIIMDRDSGRSKGFGFVEMEGADEAITALDGKDFNGRNLKVNIAQERERKYNKT